MRDTSFLKQVPFGGYPAGMPMRAPQPMVYAPPWPPPQYVGQAPAYDPRAAGRPYDAPFDPLAQMRPVGETLALAAVSFVLFGGIGALAGWLFAHTTKGAVVGAALGLAALQGSSAIRRTQ